MRNAVRVDTIAVVQAARGMEGLHSVIRAPMCVQAVRDPDLSRGGAIDGVSSISQLEKRDGDDRVPPTVTLLSTKK